MVYLLGLGLVICSRKILNDIDLCKMEVFFFVI